MRCVCVCVYFSLQQHKQFENCRFTLEFDLVHNFLVIAASQYYHCYSYYLILCAFFLFIVPHRFLIRHLEYVEYSDFSFSSPHSVISFPSTIRASIFKIAAYDFFFAPLSLFLANVLTFLLFGRNCLVLILCVSLYKIKIKSHWRKKKVITQ